MAYTYEDVIPSMIENTVMQKRLLNGVHRTYLITPVDGYVMHDNRLDVVDENGNAVLNYTAGTKTVPAAYDFTANMYEIYAVPRDTVPDDHIFGIVPGGNPEVM